MRSVRLTAVDIPSKHEFSSGHLLQASIEKARAAQRTLLRKTEGLDPSHTLAMEDMATWKGTSDRFIQRLQTYRTGIRRRHISWLAKFRWLRINRLKRIRIRVALDSLTIAHSHTKPLVFAFLPVLPLAGFTAIENKFAPGAGLERQVRAVASADTAVGALSLVARAGLAGTRRCKGRARPSEVSGL